MKEIIKSNQALSVILKKKVGDEWVVVDRREESEKKKEGDKNE